MAIPMTEYPKPVSFNPDDSHLEASSGWQKLDVDTGWPPTWEHRHCSQCDAPWYTIEKHESMWILWRNPSRVAYDNHTAVRGFYTAEQAVHYVQAGNLELYPFDVCEHVDPA